MGKELRDTQCCSLLVTAIDWSLASTLTSCQDAELKAHSVVLVSNKEEHAVDQNTPNSDVGEDPGYERVRIYCCSSDCVDSHEVERQWPRDDWNMNETWSSRVAEVRSGQVEEVDDQEHLAQPKMGAAPQMDSTKPEEIVHN